MAVLSDLQINEGSNVKTKTGGVQMKQVKQVGSALALCLATSGTVLAATDLSMWYHGGGNEVEKAIIDTIISDFNGSQSDWNVKI